MDFLQELVDAADTAALLRAVDGLCANREWDRLSDLGRRCRDAVEMGKQLWPVATHIDYRLALEASAPHAAAVLRPGAGRFALGPLTEVAAGGHAWADLRPHLPDPYCAGAVAVERVLRGEDLRGVLPDGVALDTPPRLQDWEPAYVLPVYHDREARFPQPGAATRTLPPPSPLPAATIEPEDDAVEALRAVTETWVSQSSGEVAAVRVAGDAPQAVAALLGDGDPRGIRASLSPMPAADALAILQWAGSSGGAYGVRRGGAAGRFSALWAVAALAGLAWEAPDDPAWLVELGRALDELRWYRWAPEGSETGWVLRLAVADPADGLAWAVDATDHAGEDPPV